VSNNAIICERDRGAILPELSTIENPFRQLFPVKQQLFSFQ